MSQCTAAGAGASYNDVIMISLCHILPPFSWHLYGAAEGR